MPDETLDLPFIPLALDGVEYKLCLDFGAIQKAEREIRLIDPTVMLLFAPWLMTIDNVKALFAASLRTYHPEIGYEAAKALVTWRTGLPIADALAEARKQFMPEALEQDDPPQAPAQSL